MLKITEENIASISFEGIWVSEPKFNFKGTNYEGVHEDIAFISEFGNELHFVYYNDQYFSHGLYIAPYVPKRMADLKRLMDRFNFYRFDDMEEFCKWYLKQKCGYQTLDKVLNKEWIQEKCGTNKPPKEAPKQRSIGYVKGLDIISDIQKVLDDAEDSKLKELYGSYWKADDTKASLESKPTRRDKLKDTIQLYKWLKSKERIMSARPNTEDQKILMETFNNAFNNWLDEEVDY